jgi:competence protein ComEC
VGQGQWVTVVDRTHCLHFDMGGEALPPRRDLAICRSRKNSLFLTHLDRDHISFIEKMSTPLRICLAQNNPLDPRADRVKLPACRHDQRARIKIWRPGTDRDLSPNERSLIYVVDGRILIPGDSTARQEQQWARDLSEALTGVRILVAGHHGSKTSTSDALLRALPKVDLAMASSRKRVYGHPHFTVVSRLRHHFVPLVATEQFGALAWRY